MRATPLPSVAPMGTGDAAAGAVEEVRSEIALELLDRFGHRRLGDRELAGGAGNRSGLGDGDEILELAEFEGQGPLRLEGLSLCPAAGRTKRERHASGSGPAAGNGERLGRLAFQPAKPPPNVATDE